MPALYTGMMRLAVEFLFVILQVHFVHTESKNDIYSLYISFTLVVWPALNTEKKYLCGSYIQIKNIDYGIIMATWKFPLEFYNWIFFQKIVSLLNTLNTGSLKPHRFVIRQPVKGFNLINNMSWFSWHTFSFRWLAALVKCNMMALVARDLA